MAKGLVLTARLTGLVGLMFFTFMAGLSPGRALADKFSEIPVKGFVTMIDLGADKCIPCKMMAPILKKMRQVYQGKAAIIFIDVWKYKDQAKRFNVKVIPTQIFFDATGREVYRHAGFMSEKAIRQQIEKMGAK